MMKRIISAFILGLLVLPGCSTIPQENSRDTAITSNTSIISHSEANVYQSSPIDDVVSNSVDCYQQGDNEYRKLLGQYYELLLEYNESEYAQFHLLDYRMMDMIQILLEYRESILEQYPCGYELYYNNALITIRYSEILKANGYSYRFVTYIPSYNSSVVFAQAWTDGDLHIARLHTVLHSPTDIFEIADIRIIRDGVGVYVNILMKRVNWDICNESYEIYTYKIENGIFKSYIPVEGVINYGDWLVEDNSFYTNYSGIEIKSCSDKDTWEWFKIKHEFEGNTLSISEIANSDNSINLIFDDGMWKLHS